MLIAVVNSLMHNKVVPENSVPLLKCVPCPTFEMRTFVPNFKLEQLCILGTMSSTK